MPTAPLRPTPEVVQQIDRVIRRGDLTKDARLRLNIVLAWAQGQTVRQIVESGEFDRSREVIRRSIRRFQEGGMEAFLRPRPNGGRGGKPPVPADKAAAVAEALRRSFVKGEVLPYRELRKSTGLSLSTISKIAKRFHLDAENRRGAVGPQSGGGNGKATAAR